MRRRLVAVALAVAAMIAIAFLVPLAGLVRELARSRALTGAERDAQLVARVVTIGGENGSAQSALDALGIVDSINGLPVSIILPDGTVTGSAIPPGEDLTAPQQGASGDRAVPGGAAVYVPVVSAAGTVVVRVFVPNSELSRNVAQSWMILGALGLLEAEDESDLIGRLRSESMTPQALQSIIPQLIAVWSGIDHLVLQVRDGRTLRGSRLEGLLSWTAPVTPDGLDLSRVIVAIVDVTGIRSAHEDLEALVRSRDELVATVSHELRTPLTTVVGLSHELRDAFHSFDRDEVIELIGLIAQQSSEVVEDLLVAARTRGGSLGVSATPVDLAREAVATLQSLGLRPEKLLTAPRYLPAVTGDPGRIRQILRNLVTNAQRYGGDEFRVVVRSGDSIAAVEVRDTGPPLSQDESDEIFGRYYRTRQTPGITASVGLGLTISQELARLMGGDITYHQDGESVFTVRLPVAERSPVSTAPMTPIAPVIPAAPVLEASTAPPSTAEPVNVAEPVSGSDPARAACRAAAAGNTRGGHRTTVFARGAALT